MVRVLGVLICAVLVLAACGGAASPASATAAPSGGAATAAAAAGSDVTVQGFAFSPGSLEVKVGTKVTWTNKDGTTHTTTSGTPTSKDGKWDGQLSGSGGTFSFTFPQAGTFAYFCQIHGSAMTAMVVVR